MPTCIALEPQIVVAEELATKARTSIIASVGTFWRVKI
jgi:hypothetical protein